MSAQVPEQRQQVWLQEIHDSDFLRRSVAVAALREEDYQSPHFEKCPLQSLSHEPVPHLKYRCCELITTSEAWLNGIRRVDQFYPGILRGITGIAARSDLYGEGTCMLFATDLLRKAESGRREPGSSYRAHWRLAGKNGHLTIAFLEFLTHQVPPE